MLLEAQAIPAGTGHAAGRALLAQMYRRQFGEEMPPILLTPRGKPYWENSPLHFSVSHTRHHVFCVISRFPVGIDAEERNRNIRLELAPKLLSPSEMAQLESAPDKRLALLTLWVLKEAQVKATGEGLRSYPNRTDFSLADPRVTVIDNCLVAVIEMNGKRENVHERKAEAYPPGKALDPL